MITTTTSLAPLLERFFTQRLMQQRQASLHTISSYRDTFRMLQDQELQAQGKMSEEGYGTSAPPRGSLGSPVSG
jgi:site-specific recombinase XerC